MKGLITFLDYYGVYDEFKAHGGVDCICKMAIEDMDDWSTTESGEAFWLDINNKWINYWNNVSTAVVINEQHFILPEQHKLLPYQYETVKVPAKGWTLLEMSEMVVCAEMDCVIFISPVPALMKLCSLHNISWQVMHNDRRDKVELPDGRIIMTLAKEGWVLV